MAEPTPSSAINFPGGASRKTAWLIVAAGVALFLGLGIPQLSRPFHGDEVEFVRLGVALIERGSHLIDRGFIDDVTETSQFQHWNFHPPLYAWGLGAAIRIFGISEVTARGFGLACGVGSLLLVFALGLRLKAPGAPRHLTAAVAVLLCAVNPFFLQASLTIDIDGTVYPLLLLLLVWLALVLDQESERRRLPVLTLGFAFALAAKMTTILAFPAVLCGYHLARARWRQALGDAMVVGALGLGLFLAAYRGYAAVMDLNFAELFTHTGRSGTGFSPVNLATRGLAFLLPLPLVWMSFAARDPFVQSVRRSTLLLIATGLAVLAGLSLLRPATGLRLTWFHNLTSYFLITVPFLTPGLVTLYYAALVRRAPRWVMRQVEPIDLVIGLAAAVLVAYVSVMTRGGSFSFYQAPVLPLIALAAASAIAVTVARPEVQGRGGARLGGIAILCFAYGLAVIGDAYFLVKYQMFAVEGRELFAAIVRWWARLHTHDPGVHRTLANYLGYQPAGLAVMWYALVLLPVAIAGWFGRRGSRTTNVGALAAMGAAAFGLSLSLSLYQSLADYRTGMDYGRDTTSTRRMAELINASIPLTAPYLAPRGLSHYLNQTGYIDETRFRGGYRGATTAQMNARGELVLIVDPGMAPHDELPRQPIHFAVGRYPLLDDAPSYRVVRQVGPLKLYQYIGVEPGSRKPGS